MKVICFGFIGLLSVLPSIVPLAQAIELPIPPTLTWTSPARDVIAPRDALVRLAILPRQAGVGLDTNTFQMFLNGQNITTNAAVDSTAARSLISYQHPALYDVGSTQTVVVTYAHTGLIPVSFTNEFSFLVGETPDPLYSESNFFIEAEDFNFDGGFYLTNAALRSAMANVPGLVGIDFNRFPRAIDFDNYRKGEGPGVNVKIQAASSDGPRIRFQSGVDYKVIGTEINDWFAYTRIFPTNDYAVYVRFSSQTNNLRGQLHRVTAGRASADQTIELLGAFEAPSTRSTNIYAFAPLKSGGTNVVLSLGGETTLRLTTLAANMEFQYLMFVPQILEGPTLFIARSLEGFTVGWTPLGGRLQSAAEIAGPWNEVGVTNPIPVLSVTNGTQFFRVVRP